MMKNIGVLSVLVILTIASLLVSAAPIKPSIDPQATTCVNAKNGALSKLTVYASVYSSPQGSTGTGKAYSDETYPGSSVGCVQALVHVVISPATGIGWSGYIGIPGSVSKTFYNVGGYIETYAKSLCDGISVRVGAFLNGGCLTSCRPIDNLQRILEK